MAELMINKSQKYQAIDKAMQAVLLLQSVPHALQTLSFIDEHCELAIAIHQAVRLEEILMQKIRDTRTIDIIRIRAMQTLTLFYCLAKKSTATFSSFVQLLAQWIQLTNNGKSQFVRSKALQCLEELHKHEKLNLTNFLYLGQLGFQGIDERKNRPLLELLKDSNDWTTPGYSSLVRTIAQRDLHSQIPADHKSQLKQVSSAMWEIKDQCSEIELVGILKFMFQLKEQGTDIQEMMLLHKYRELLQFESPIVLQFLLFTLIHNSQKFEDSVFERLIQKLIAKVNDFKRNRGVSTLCLRWLKYLLDNGNLKKKYFHPSSQMMPIDLYPLPLRNQIIQTFLTFKGKLIPLTKTITQINKAFQKAPYYIANSSNIVSMFRNFYFLICSCNEDSQKPLRLQLNLITQILRLNSNFQWNVVALGEKLSKEQNGKKGICPQSLFQDHILRSIYDFKPQSRLELYFPMLIFFSKKDNVDDQTILEILIRIESTQPILQQIDSSTKWQPGQNLLKVCRNLLMKNKNRGFQDKLASFLSRLEDQGKDICLRDEANFLRTMITQIDTSFKQNMLLEPSYLSDIRPPDIKQFSYGDQPIPGIELHLNKELRKSLKLFDGASSVFECQVAPERQARVKGIYQQLAFQLNSTEGDLQQVITDQDILRLQQPLHCVSDVMRDQPTQEDSSEQVFTQRGIILPFTLRMNSQTSPFDKVLNIELFFAQLDSVKVSYPQKLPLLQKVATQPPQGFQDQRVQFPNEYQLNVSIETTQFIPFLLEASASFNTEDGVFHYGYLGQFQVEYEDFFLQRLPQASREVFDSRWEQITQVTSIRVLYLERQKVLQEIHARLKPFIVEQRGEEAEVAYLDVYIVLPPSSVLLLKFRIKGQRTQVSIRSDNPDVLNWVDSFFDKWD